MVTGAAIVVIGRAGFVVVGGAIVVTAAFVVRRIVVVRNGVVGRTVVVVTLPLALNPGFKHCSTSRQGECEAHSRIAAVVWLLPTTGSITALQAVFP